MLDAAELLEDLRVPPGNRLEALKGGRAGQHSITVNQHWRICRRCHMATITPIHPGEVLLEEFLEPLGVTQHRLAVSIGVPPGRINEIVHGKRRITAATALGLHATSERRTASG